jgi:hypothetical protein
VIAVAIPAGCSSAEPASAFIGNAKINCKVELGLKTKCKFVSVLTSKKCQLFLGRDTVLTNLLIGLCRQTGNASKKIKNTPTR